MIELLVTVCFVRTSECTLVSPNTSYLTITQCAADAPHQAQKIRDKLRALGHPIVTRHLCLPKGTIEPAVQEQEDGVSL